MAEKLISKSIVINLLRFAKQRDIALNIPMDIAEAEEMLPFSRYALLSEEVSQQVGEVGIYMGEEYSIAALGIVGQLISACRTIGEALEKSRETFNLFSNVLRLEFERRGRKFRMKLHMDKKCEREFPIASRNLVTSSMMFAYKEIEFLTLKNYKPLQVSFAHDSDLKENYDRLFDADVKFKSKFNAIEFDAAILDEKIISSDYKLLIHLEELACRRLNKQLEQLDSFTDKVQSVVYALLDPYFPSLETIAAHMNMSERSLQRKLKEEGSSFSSLIKNMKSEVAADYLTKDLSVKEVGYLLGYSEPSAFVNAFKSWYGETPKAFQMRT